MSTESSAARPTIISASQPQRLPATAKPLLASESLIRSVSGLLPTTANFAEVVSGLPTSGLNANTRGFRRERIDVRSTLVEQQPDAKSAAAQELTERRVSQRDPRGESGCYIDAKVAAVVAMRHLSLRHRPTESARNHRRGAVSQDR